LKVASPAEISAAVEASFAGCADDRLRAVLQSLVRHLHAFAMEVELTEAEWLLAPFGERDG
jgi:hydroxyquinol 1,2-dioxygenase